jgi:S-adenosylmethionine synthetase
MTDHLYAAEYVLPGHPDKLCDAIADGLVQEATRREKRALCGIEVAVHRATVFITGRIACRNAEEIDIKKVVRDVYATAGYGGRWQPDPAELRITTDLCLGPLDDGESAFRSVSDDQCVITGYAVDLPGTNYLPPEHWISWRLMKRLDCLRHTYPTLRLGPDGKLIVLYDPKSKALTAFSTSLQYEIGADEVAIQRAVREVLSSELQVISQAIPGFDTALPDIMTINGAGNFDVGGPEGDNGLSGKKLVVDAYGPRVPIGGGALSGKDLFKADRAGAILARRLAKAIVKTGIATECWTTLAIFPGDTTFRIASITTNEGTPVDPARWSKLFDLSLDFAGETYEPTLLDCARYGHFTEPDRCWEVLQFCPGRSDSTKS